MLDVHHKGKATVSAGDNGKRWRPTWRSCTPPGCGPRCSAADREARYDCAGRGARRGSSARSTRSEAAVLRDLVDQVRQMLANARGRDPGRPARGAHRHAHRPVHPPERPACWRGCCPTSTPRTPSLRRGPALAARAGADRGQGRPPPWCSTRCPRAADRCGSTPTQADAWLAALNDVRLALGTALEITEDDARPTLDRRRPGPPTWAIYRWLSLVQDSPGHGPACGC